MRAGACGSRISVSPRRRACRTATCVRPGLSPFTASPEQLRGDPPSIADDIYGLGALAYELLSGYPPYYPRFEVKRVLEEPVPEIKPAQLMPPQLARADHAHAVEAAGAAPALDAGRDRRARRHAQRHADLRLRVAVRRIAGGGATATMRRDASVLAAAEAAAQASARRWFRRASSRPREPSPNRTRCASCRLAARD